MSSPRLLALALGLVTAAVCTAQTPPTPAPAPEGTAPAGGSGVPAPTVENVKAPKFPIEETVEPIVAEDGKPAPTAADVVAKALAYMGGDRLAAAKTLALERRSLHWDNRRFVFPERYSTQAKLSWPPIARVTEISFDTVKRKPRPEMMFVQNGADAFMQSGLEVYSYPANEVTAKSRIATELGVPLLLSWLAHAKAPMTLDGRATVRSFTPKTFLGIQRDDKKDEGFTDYEPSTATYLRVSVEVPADLAVHFGPSLHLYFDATDGRLARWRMFPLSRSVDRFGDQEIVFEVESYATAVDGAGAPTAVKVPGVVYAMLAASAERVETIELSQVVVDSDLKDDLFRRP